MTNPDSIVEYVTWLDKRFNRLVDAISTHRAFKSEPYDSHDIELWMTLNWAYSDEN